MNILYKLDENPECYPRQIVIGDVTWLWQYDHEDQAQPNNGYPILERFLSKQRQTSQNENL